MKYALALLSLLFSMSLFATNDLVVFAEDGERFFLHVNGEQINDLPKARVEARGLETETALVRVVFEKEELQALKKTIAFFNPNTELTARILMTNKGYRIRMFGERTLDEVIVEDNDMSSAVSVEYQDAEPVIESGSTVTVVEQTTTVTETETETEAVNMSIGVPGVNVDVNLQVNDGVEPGVTTTTTTTTTTVTGGTIAEPTDHSVVIVEEDPCAGNMLDANALESSLESEAFADDKMMIAKQAIKGSCLYVRDVESLTPQFAFEDDKVEFLKFCYDKCLDQQNYYKLNKLLTFSSSKDELNSFIQKR